MYKATVNQQDLFEITRKGNEVYVNDEGVEWEAVKRTDGAYSVRCGLKNYRADIRGIDKERKTLLLQVNGQEYEVVIEEPADQLLKTMGIRPDAVHKVNEIRASMPGLVLKVLVTPGQALRKGDPVLILEAMKMENVFKAMADAVVKSVKVTERTAVEKGQVLVVLE